MKTLILGHTEVKSLLTMQLALPAVERAFASHGQGTAVMPPKVYLPIVSEDGDFRAMPGYMEGAAGVKWVNAHPKNPSRHNLPTVMAVYILSDPATGLPLSILDATLLTAFRTGAAAAVASKYLAMTAPRSLGLVGSGVQARMLVDAHRLLYPNLDVMLSDVSEKAAQRLAAEVGGRAVGMKEASGADIVCTATPSREPIVHRGWVKEGVHINAMGADAPGKQELDPLILRDAYLVVDDMHQATESGEVNVPLHHGELELNHISASLGEVVCGIKPGRGSATMTVFDSTGLAIQDLALARTLYEAARREGVGNEVDLLGAA